MEIAPEKLIPNVKANHPNLRIIFPSIKKLYDTLDQVFNNHAISIVVSLLRKLLSDSFDSICKTGDILVTFAEIFQKEYTVFVPD